MSEAQDPLFGLVDLPDAVLDQIFSSVPTEIVAGTYSLSKNWRDSWTIASNLDLDETDPFWEEKPYRDNEAKHALEARRNRLQLQRRKRIDGILSKYIQLHDGPVKSFKLTFTTTKLFDSRVDRWLKYATSKGVETLDLDLRFSKWDEPVHEYRLLPSVLSNGSTIKVLKLRGCVIEYPSLSMVQAPRNVRELLLDEVEIAGSLELLTAFLSQCDRVILKKVFLISDHQSEDNATNGLIIGERLKLINAPNLKKLSIVSCTPSLFEGSEIHVPNLQRFKFDGARVRFSLKSCSQSLQKATLMVSRERGIDDNLLKALNHVCCTEKLVLGFRANSGTPFFGVDTEGLRARVPLKPFPFLRDLLIVTNEIEDDRFRFIIDFLSRNSPPLTTFEQIPEFMLLMKHREEKWARFLSKQYR